MIQSLTSSIYKIPTYLTMLQLVKKEGKFLSMAMKEREMAGNDLNLYFILSDLKRLIKL